MPEVNSSAVPGSSGIAWRWRIALLLCAVTAINYLDRQALAVTAPLLVGEFSLSNTEFGLIGSSFLFAYALGQIGAGVWIDRVGTRRAFAIAVVAWSVAGILHAAARGFWSLLSLRALLGVAEAANFPAALKAVAEWFPSAERSMAVGIVLAGTGVGAILAPPLLGGLAVAFGWQAAFIVPGAVGILWYWLWLRWYRHPRAHDIGPDVQGPATDEEPSLGRLLATREVRGMLLSRFLNDGGFYFFLTWLPLYLAQSRGMALAEIAAFAWLPFVMADLGNLAGGWAGQRLIGAGLSVDASRKLCIWAGALLVAVVLPFAGEAGIWGAIGLISAALFGIQFKASSLFALPADVVPSAAVGRLWGVFGAVGSLGGMAFVAAAGLASEHLGYAPVFIAAGVTQLLSAVAINWLVRRIAPLELKARS
ncbi:MAG: MFS transporter [Gammaproteobacteria bacterium]|nr:MFS transporter [Gammaproteobacteria bacterium]